MLAYLDGLCAALLAHETAQRYSDFWHFQQRAIYHVECERKPSPFPAPVTGASWRLSIRSTSITSSLTWSTNRVIRSSAILRSRAKQKVDRSSFLSAK